jgi:adenylyltransferase/sulfurtransferase
MTDVLRITPRDVAGDVGAPPSPTARDERFDRFNLIGWWDQSRLARARVLVCGAGALGNEIIKNLALLGVGNLFVADMDRVENSNLSRSVLYREADNGAFKATVAARGAKDIYPDVKVQHFNGNIVHDLGLGVYRWADVVIGGLDNREARLAINRNCWKVNRPWIDGAIESIDGSARVFVPDGPCYECTMSQQDWKLLQMRRSCNLLSRPEMASGGGKTPTTPTVSSIIAGVQCQEAVKLLHGMPTIAGGAFVFNGVTADSYVTRFQRKDDCYSHDTLDEVVALDDGVESITPRELLSRARSMLGPRAELELAREVLEKLVCPSCKAEEAVFASLGKVSPDKAWCPRCANVRREVVTFHKIRGGEDFLDRPLAEIGVPAFDIIIARGAERSVGFELAGDAANVLGELLSSDEALELV